MFNEFMTAFSPFITSFFAAIDRIVGIFLSDEVVNGVPQGITLFDVPILLYPLGFMLIVLLFKTVFEGKEE